MTLFLSWHLVFIKKVPGKKLNLIWLKSTNIMIKKMSIIFTYSFLKLVPKFYLKKIKMT